MDKLRCRAALLFDISFVLILCFAVLFITMMISKKYAPSEGGLSVNYPMLAAVAGAVALYIAIVVRVSVRETEAMTALYKAGAKDSAAQKRPA